MNPMPSCPPQIDEKDGNLPNFPPSYQAVIQSDQPPPQYTQGTQPMVQPALQLVQQPGYIPTPLGAMVPPGYMVTGVPGIVKPTLAGQMYQPIQPQFLPTRQHGEMYQAIPGLPQPGQMGMFQQYFPYQFYLPRGRPTVAYTKGFNASNEAALLRKAMRYLGTDNDAIINVLCRIPSLCRLEIAKAYHAAYDKHLIDDIKSDTSFNFKKLLVALLTPMPDFYAKQLHYALEGFGTSEKILIGILNSLNNYDIRAVKASYTRIHGKSLEDSLKSDTSGYFRRLMLTLANANRDESMLTDENQAKIDAKLLKTSGIDRWGTDESEFIRILCLRNSEQVKVIAREYEILTGNTLEKDIEKEFSGDIRRGLKAVLHSCMNRPEFFASRLYKAMAGPGTNDRNLIRLIVTRSEIDMEDIKEAFLEKYGQSLKSYIIDDTSGHYKDALLVLIGEIRDGDMDKSQHVNEGVGQTQ